MINDVIFRPITKVDLPGIHAVALESWQHTYRWIFNPKFIQNFVKKNYSPEAIVSLFPQIQSGFMFFYVAEYEERIIGFCNIGISDKRAELHRMYLLPTYMRHGIGKKLLDFGETFVIEQGIRSYFCLIHKKNEIGMKFYLKSGFEYISEKDKDDEWYMEKRIS